MIRVDHVLIQKCGCLKGMFVVESGDNIHKIVVNVSRKDSDGVGLWQSSTDQEAKNKKNEWHVRGWEIHKSEEIHHDTWIPLRPNVNNHETQ